MHLTCVTFNCLNVFIKVYFSEQWFFWQFFLSKFSEIEFKIPLQNQTTELSARIKDINYKTSSLVVCLLFRAKQKFNRIFEEKSSIFSSLNLRVPKGRYWIFDSFEKFWKVLKCIGSSESAWFWPFPILSIHVSTF